MYNWLSFVRKQSTTVVYILAFKNEYDLVNNMILFMAESTQYIFVIPSLHDTCALCSLRVFRVKHSMYVA